jgi:protein-tyrosine-phosphatase
MKILFVCRGNIGRSQAAMELYNLNSDTPASSAGTEIYEDDKTVGERAGAKSIVQVMKSEGIDISKNRSTQITPKMVDDFDKVIVMAEIDRVPAWLKDHKKTVWWDIPDLKDVSIEEAQDTVKLIKTKLEGLNK